MDLRFAGETDRKKFTCATCPSSVKLARKCADPGWDNLKSPMSVGDASRAYTFCPGKATWSAHAAELFEQCRVTLETGIMPKGPNLDDQDAYFAACLPAFVERWRERSYRRMWDDIGDFTSSVLKALFPK